MHKPMVIGIAGGTGSGKTTLTRAIEAKFAPQAAVVFHDNYYRPHDELPLEERAKLNYDHPDAFDNDYMVEQLHQLINGQAIDCPTYDYSMHTRAKETVRIEPAPLILVEGIVLFVEQRLCDLFDVKIFVDTDADVRILRRVKRDVIERGRTVESVEAQYLATVKPMHELYVAPSKRQADIIVPEGGRNLVALDMLVHRISNELAQG
ncbi:uridine kinase [Trueperella pecoris]|uniref:Uridine kinase n=1 Tax=Trueperella pecoris TaxID=2733571 RepID=A0A7M1QT33_9ACTO|nr:uridine kinase [Trueperella pecoris]QOR45159.1 uridine kinase [Trueperella pecoris]QTG75065.1 uridine kinase [Trueperella pecoris]